MAVDIHELDRFLFAALRYIAQNRYLSLEASCKSVVKAIASRASPFSLKMSSMNKKYGGIINDR